MSVNYRIRINPAVFTAPSSINDDIFAAGPSKAHIYIGSVNHEANNIVQHPSGRVLKPYGTNPYLLDITAIGIIIPEPAFKTMSARAYRMQIADLVLRDLLEVAWVSGSGSGVVDVSGVLFP